jgi:hypothetical protein
MTAEQIKELKIQTEVDRLKKIFLDLDENKLATVMKLIENAAFITVSVEELQNIINELGYTEEYQNGANQSGRKQRDEVKTHIAYTKEQKSILKILADLAPPRKKKSTLLSAIKSEDSG